MKSHGCLSLAALAVFVTLLAGCSRDTGLSPDSIRAQGELIILTRNGPTTYYEGRDGFDGFEYALTQRLASDLGVAARYVVYNSITEVLAAIERNEGHLVAAGLTRTDTRAARFLFGPDYQSVQQQLVCHRDDPRPKAVTDLIGRSLLILRGSSYEERLLELQSEIPELSWSTTDELSTEQILEQVWRREVNCTVADSNIVAINRRYFPELDVALPLTDEQSLAWIVRQGGEKLSDFLSTWLEGLEESGALAALHDRYYGHVPLFDYVDTATYIRRIDKRLPTYRQLFEEAAEKHGLDWKLLAAQAYQESHWNPKAKSPTGVRGMMMLTLPTAKDLGVKSRLDPRQSVMGGARYLTRIEKRIPPEVKAQERLWFALAAYNVGMGHLYDARTLAERLGKDPNKWHDLKSVFPLLSQKQYYATLKHGYARGSEPVRYVQRIRHYRDILRQHVDRLAQVDPSS